MTRTTTFGIGLATVLALAAGLVSTTPVMAQARTGGGTVIRTVDLVKAFGLLLQKTDGDNEIRDLKEKLDKDMTQLQRELDALRKELELYKPDSAEYRQAEEKVLQKLSALSAHNEFSERRLLLEQRLKTLQIYTSLRKGVEAYARDNGISLVLMADEPNLVDARNQQELLSKISLRKVIYVDETLDITKSVVEKLNAEYLRERGKKTP